MHPARAQADHTLVEQIKATDAIREETYGRPRICAEVADKGIRPSRKRIARLMRAQASRRDPSPGLRQHCGGENPKAMPTPNVVWRKFVATDINQLWVADMTYIPTWQGFLCLGVVTDVVSRKVVGWALGARMSADLVVCALIMRCSPKKT